MSQRDLLERAERVLPGGVLGGHRSAPGLEVAPQCFHRRMAGEVVVRAEHDESAPHQFSH